MPSSRTIVEKADIAVSNLTTDGGYLNAEQANKFLDIIIDEPTLLNRIRNVRMNAPKRKIEKIGFGNRILKVAPDSGEALDASDRSKPDLDQIELETKEIIAEVWIPYDVLEDNIERAGIEDTIMKHMAMRVALDLEELLLQGDETASDPYLALVDGVLQMSSNATIDATDKGYGADLWKALINAMPTKYLRNIGLMNFFSSYQTEHEYRDVLADRATALGDRNIQGRNPVFGFGVELAPCALMPNGNIAFTYHNNIIWGVQRDIMIEKDRDIRRRVIQIVLTMRIDFKCETADALVVAENVGASASA
jgi:HK97 family phage major capsid protein